jgi:hypothetical protein
MLRAERLLARLYHSVPLGRLAWRDEVKRPIADQVTSAHRF